ncbi:hypothetical protein D3C78_883750 [compost metagenome]
MPGHHALHPERIDDALRGPCAGPVVAEERAAGDIPVQLRTVGDGAGADIVEDHDRQALGVLLGQQHERRHGRDQPGLGDTPGAMPADVATDLATAGGEAEQDGILQVQRLDKFGQIVGVGVHLVAVPRLAGTPVATAVMGDATEAVVGEEQHLRFPTVGAQRPAMAEHDRLAGAPVLVVDLGAVAGCDVAHLAPSFGIGVPDGHTGPPAAFTGDSGSARLSPAATIPPPLRVGGGSRSLPLFVR